MIPAWARPAIVFEWLALAGAVWIAVALFQDDRVTVLHTVSLVIAVVLCAVPALHVVSRYQPSVAVDARTALALSVPMLGSFTIGGLAFAIPALFLGVAGVSRHVASTGNRALHRQVFKGLIAFGALMFVGGAVSMGPGVIAAPVGLLLLIIGVISLRSAAVQPDPDRRSSLPVR